MAVAEHIDQSTAPLNEKLRRFLLALAQPDAVYFYGDGFPKPTIASEAYAFLADIAAGRLIVTPSAAHLADSYTVRPPTAESGGKA
jgi:hypothetical protein